MKCRKLIIYILEIIFFATCLMFFGTTYVSATTSLTFETFVLEENATIRYADNKQDMGLKYAISISKVEYDNIISTCSNVTFGIIIVPVDYLTLGNEINGANVFGIGGEQKYGWAKKNPSGGWLAYTDTKTQIINLSTDRLAYSEEGNYKFYGSIVNILENNKDRVFKSFGYILYSDSNVQKVVFAENETSESSVAYTSQIEIERLNDISGQESKEEMDKKVSLLTRNYIDGVKSFAQKNYYQMNTDGKFEIIFSENTQFEQIGQSITGEKKEFDGLSYNELKSVETKKLYANNKTELEFYYYKNDYGYIDRKDVKSFDYTNAFPNAKYTLKGIVWEGQSGTLQPNKYFEHDVSSLSNNGKLDFQVLQGDCIFSAEREGIIETFRFDAIDSNEFEWNKIQNYSDEYARAFEVGVSDRTDSQIVDVVSLQDELHTGKYVRFDYLTDKENLLSPESGGFSVLSLHRKEYYEKELLKNPQTFLSFYFKVKGVRKDGTILGLAGNGDETYCGNTYLHGAKINQNETKSSDYKYEISSIKAQTYDGKDRWYFAQIPLSTLLDNWERMRGGTIERQKVLSSNNDDKMFVWTKNADYEREKWKSFEIWVGDFSFVNITRKNLAPTPGMFEMYISQGTQTDQMTSNGQSLSDEMIRYGVYYENDDRWSYYNARCTYAPATPYEGGYFEDANNMGKLAIASFRKPNCESYVGKRMLMSVRMPTLTKQYLIEMKEQGRTKLSFSFVMDTTFKPHMSIGPVLEIETLDFDYLRLHPDEKVYSNDSEKKVNIYAFTASKNQSWTTNKSLKLELWNTIEYSLDDLISCFDQIHINDVFLLATPGLGFHNEANFYVSSIAIF